MSNRGLVSRFVHALMSGNSERMNEWVATHATYRGPLVDQAAGTVPLNGVINSLINSAPLPWILVSIVENEAGTVVLHRELRIAGGVAHAETIEATIRVHDGKIARWMEHRENAPNDPLVADTERGFTEANAAARAREVSGRWT